jgi:RNA polymerase sigma factor (sigma-70 family)
MGTPTEKEFGDFMAIAEPRLHRALVAAYGWQRGHEATADALSYAWEHWNKIRGMENSLGYLFRVGQSRLRHRKVPELFERPADSELWYEPRLAKSLSDLSERQRVAVVLVCGYQWTTREVGELLGIRATTVQSHLARALASLRIHMEVQDHA